MSYSKAEQKQIATTILAQLGGRQFIAMTGAKNMASHKEGALSLRFRGSRIANYVKITLYNDLYNIEFGKVGKKGYAKGVTFDGLYFNMLQDTFEEETGLYVTLHRRTEQ